MIRHIYVAKVRDDITDERIEELLAAWRTLPGSISEIRSFTTGRNIHPTDRRFTVAVVADFEDTEAWKRWMAHPAHLKVMKEYSEKILDLDSRRTVQIEI